MIPSSRFWLARACPKPPDSEPLSLTLDPTLSQNRRNSTKCAIKCRTKSPETHPLGQTVASLAKQPNASLSYTLSHTSHTLPEESPWIAQGSHQHENAPPLIIQTDVEVNAVGPSGRLSSSILGSYEETLARAL